MERVPKGVYTKEFKEEAVKLVTEAGLSIPEASRRLSVGKSTIEYWVRQSKKGVLSDYPRKRAVSTEDMELVRLRKENAELKMEREILKNPPQRLTPSPVMRETCPVYSTKEERPHAFWCFSKPVKKHGPGMKATLKVATPL